MTLRILRPLGRRSGLLLVTLGLAAIVPSCRPTGPDYTPFADGLKALGICLVAYGVVRSLGELIIHQTPPKNPPTPPPSASQPSTEEKQP